MLEMKCIQFPTFLAVVAIVCGCGAGDGDSVEVAAIDASAPTCAEGGVCDAGVVCDGSSACEDAQPDPCENVSCSDLGSCIVVGDTAQCDCMDGYHAVGLSCVADAPPTDPPFDVPSIYLPDATKFIHWSVPLRAYPGILLDFKLTGYDWFNRALTWSLDAAPTGMTIDSSTGVITWTPTSPAQLGSHSVSVRMTPGSGLSITRTWTIEVNTTDFIFVATTGSDATGDGSQSSPYGTLDRALEDIGTEGKTVYVREGTYVGAIDWKATGGGPLSGKTFPTTDYVLIAAYPGEAPIFDLNGGGGIEFNYGQEGIGLDGLEVRNGYQIDGAGIMLQQRNLFAKRCTVHDQTGTTNGNASGYVTAAKTLLDTCIGFDNHCVGGTSSDWNCTDFLYYADKFGTGQEESFWIDCLSYGVDYTWRVGFKIKHAGTAGQLHAHRCVAHDVAYPFMWISNYSSIRYSIGVATGTGSFAGGPGTTTDTDRGYLLGHNLLVVDSQQWTASAWGKPGYQYYNTTEPETGARLHANQFVSIPGGGGNGGFLILSSMENAPDQTSVDAQDLSIIDNQLFAPSDSGLLRLGSNSLGLAEINARATDSGNTYAPVPETIDKEAAGGEWRWTRSTNGLTRLP